MTRDTKNSKSNYLNHFILNFFVNSQLVWQYRGIFHKNITGVIAEIDLYIFYINRKLLNYFSIKN